MPRVPDRATKWFDPLEPGVFPFADGESLADAPPCCPRCQGIWRAVDEGVVCRQCGRRWRAAACLRELVSRARFNAERWPSARLTGTGPKLQR
jgi:hypothetical protein